MLYEKIKALCKDKKISIRYLEKNLGFSNGCIRKWNVVSPGVERVKKVADYFGVSIEYFLGGWEKWAFSD